MNGTQMEVMKNMNKEEARKEEEFWSFNGEEEEKKQRGREEGASEISEGRERRFWAFLKNDFLFFFLFFSKNNCHMSHFKWSKRVHLFPLI